MKRRVVVTGYGALTPIGHTADETFSNLIKGVNGIDKITYFDTTECKAKLAAELKNFDLEQHFDKKEIKRSDKVMLYGLVSGRQAYHDANLKAEDYDPYRFGVYMASGIGGLQTIEEEVKTSALRHPNRISPFFCPNAIANMSGAMIAIEFGLKGACLPSVTACAAGANAIGEAYRAIMDGYLDLAIAGGTEASICEVGIYGFAALRALYFGEDKNRASIPFDNERSGFVMGEGAGALVLEEYEHAIKRGAKIHAEIVGYATTCDAFHITSPQPEAEAVSYAIKDVLKQARIKPSDVDYINCHGTSTKLNDKTETTGIKGALGDDAYKVNISSTKSMTGHMVGATGAVESIVCCKVLEEGIIPCTLNLNVKDPELDLNYTPNEAVKRNCKYAINMNLGFGGHNAVILFKKGE